jgi:hypothetical protein
VGTPACRTTRSQDKIYVHLFDWPENHELLLDGFEEIAARVTMISGEPLRFSQDGSSLKIQLPPQAPDPDVSVLVIHQRTGSLD